MARCTCAGCGERFGGLAAFDKHQRPAGTCHPPEDRGLIRHENGVWTERPMDADTRSRLRGRPGSPAEVLPGVT
jgi:hypothetical protein